MLHPGRDILLFGIVLVAWNCTGCGDSPAGSDPVIPVHGRFEYVIALSSIDRRHEADPYDPDRIRVDALVENPAGRVVVVPCFWFIPQQRVWVEAYSSDRKRDVPWERFVPQGEGSWRFRYSPNMPGRHHFRIQVTTPDGTQTISGSSFVARSIPQRPGFIRLAGNREHFAFDGGRPFVPVGQNVAWPDERGSIGYEETLKRMQGSGANAARLWLVHYFGGTSLEWTPTPTNSGYTGSGRFSQESAARVDAILEAADATSIALMVNFYSFGDTKWDWPKHPWNRINGGFLDDPQGLFSDPEARRRCKAQLRYCVARYGWSTRVWAWELWNEVETAAGFEEQMVFDWHREMTQYIKTIDPHQHLITTSYRFAPPESACTAYGLPGIDFVQAHTYSPDIVAVFRRELDSLSAFGKPLLFSEFGLHVSPNYFSADPRGQHVHDGLWAGFFSSGLGGGMTWWWDRYVAPNGLERHFIGLSRFLQMLESPVGQPESYTETSTGFAFVLRMAEDRCVWAGRRRVIAWRRQDNDDTVSSYKATGVPISIAVQMDLRAGHTYAVDLVDPYDGIVIRSSTIRGDVGATTLTFDNIGDDVAAVVRHEANPAPHREARTPVHDWMRAPP